jgi:predicted chitinase
MVDQLKKDFKKKILEDLKKTNLKKSFYVGVEKQISEESSITDDSIIREIYNSMNDMIAKGAIEDDDISQLENKLTRLDKLKKIYENSLVKPLSQKQDRDRRVVNNGIKKLRVAILRTISIKKQELGKKSIAERIFPEFSRKFGREFLGNLESSLTDDSNDMVGGLLGFGISKYKEYKEEKLQKLEEEKQKQIEMQKTEFEDSKRIFDAVEYESPFSVINAKNNKEVSTNDFDYADDTLSSTDFDSSLMQIPPEMTSVGDIMQQSGFARASQSTSTSQSISSSSDAIIGILKQIADNTIFNDIIAQSLEKIATTSDYIVYTENIAQNTDTMQIGIQRLLDYAEKSDIRDTDWRMDELEARREARKGSILDSTQDTITIKSTSTESGGILSSALGGLLGGAALKKTLGGLFKKIFNPKTMFKVLGKAVTKLALPLTIITSLGAGIIDGFKEYQKTGSIKDALVAGVSGIIDFLTFGLFDVEKVKEFIEPFMAWNVKIVGGYFNFLKSTFTAIWDAGKSMIDKLLNIVDQIQLTAIDWAIGLLSKIPIGTGGLIDSLEKQKQDVQKGIEARQSIVSDIDSSPVLGENKASTTSTGTSSTGTSSMTMPMESYSKEPLSAKETKSNLIKDLESQGITDKDAQANILANIKAESNFKPQSENLNYSAKTLMRLFGPGSGNKVRVKSMAEAQAIVDQGPEAVGNLVYGGRMGNKANEGFKYRGRGLVQLTGKNNYEEMGKKLGLDLVNNPDLANQPEIASKIAAQYYADRKNRFNYKDISQVAKATGHAGGQAETLKRAQYAQQLKMEMNSMPKENKAYAEVNNKSKNVAQNMTPPVIVNNNTNKTQMASNQTKSSPPERTDTGTSSRRASFTSAFS